MPRRCLSPSGTRLAWATRDCQRCLRNDNAVRDFRRMPRLLLRRARLNGGAEQPAATLREADTGSDDFGGVHAGARGRVCSTPNRKFRLAGCAAKAPTNCQVKFDWPLLEHVRLRTGFSRMGETQPEIPPIVHCPKCGMWPMVIEAIDMTLLRPETDIIDRCPKYESTTVKKAA